MPTPPSKPKHKFEPLFDLEMRFYERLTIRRTFRVGVFLSVVFVLVGAVMMGMNVEVISRSLETNVPAWEIYYLDWKGSPVDFYIGCGMVSAGVTFLWRDRQSKR